MFNTSKHHCVLGQAEDIPHDLDSIRAANHFATFFVEQARRMNDHKFANGQIEEAEHLIYNWYRDEIYSLQILLSRTQAGSGRTVKLEQEEISPNHI